MNVPDCVMERGSISEGKTPKNDFTSLSVHNICVVSNFKKTVETVREVSIARDGFGWRFAEFQFHSAIAIIRV